MPAAFALVGQARGFQAIEKYHRLAGESAVLRGAERQCVDPCLPAHLGRRELLGNKGVGETSSVHMNHEPSIVREGGVFGKLFASVNRPAFGRLGEGQGGGLDLLFHAARKIRKRRIEIRWRDLARVPSMPTSLAPPVNISG